MSASIPPEPWDDDFDHMGEAYQHDPLPPEATYEPEELAVLLFLGDVERESVKWSGLALALAV